MRVYKFAVTGLLLVFPLTLTYGETISNLVVFGDSLSDNGNAAAALGGQFSYKGSSNYAQNAATDGPNTNPAVPAGGPLGLWVDQLATKLNVPDPQPIVKNVNGALQLNPTGTNFAVATALTGSNPAFNLATFTTNSTVPYTSDQVSIFNSFTNKTASPTALYTFWAGSNDIASLNNPLTAANNVMSNIQTLASEGAKNFVWVDEPDLGRTPVAQAMGSVASGIASAASAGYNLQQAADIALLSHMGINVILVDVNSLMNTIPLNTTTPAMGLAGVNPDNYEFWDGEHPTTEADSYIANAAYEDLVTAGLASSGTPVATPEPASWGAAALGLLGCAFAAFRKSRQASLG